MGEVFDITTDFTAAGSFADIAANVVYNREKDYALLVRTTDIKSNFTKEDKVYISQPAFEYLWRVRLDKPSIILPNIGANCGEVHFIKPDNLPQQNCALGPNALLLRTGHYDNRFYYHFFNTPTFQKELRKIISPGGQTKFNKTELRKISIPVPPLTEQQRIVEVLDRFSTLTTDITAGLPAEIEARRKQYEYYRDQLLTFKQKA